jgi:hypothetical protein
VRAPPKESTTSPRRLSALGAWGPCSLLFQPLQSLQPFGSSLLKHLRLRSHLTPLTRQLGVNALLSRISRRLGGSLTLLRPQTAFFSFIGHATPAPPATPSIPELSKLQADVVADSARFMIATATIDAFTAGHANPSFDAALIDYVSGFVANGVGASFDPHVSTGIASIDYLDRMLAEPFLPFAFAPASAASSGHSAPPLALVVLLTVRRFPPPWMFEEARITPASS